MSQAINTSEVCCVHTSKFAKISRHDISAVGKYGSRNRFQITANLLWRRNSDGDGWVVIDRDCKYHCNDRLKITDTFDMGRPRIMMTSSNGTFPRYWPFVEGIRRPQVDSPNKGNWREALVFYLICAYTRNASDLRRHRAHYDVIVMITK